MYLWWFGNVSPWLRWATVSRIPVPVYFWLRWSSRKILMRCEGRSEAATIFELTHTVAFLLFCLKSEKQWLVLQFLHLPLAPLSASLIPVPGEWEVATTRDTVIRHWHIRGWEINLIKTGTPNLSEMSRSPVSGMLRYPSPTHLLWVEKSDLKNLAWMRESSIKSPDYYASSSATWTI